VSRMQSPYGPNGDHTNGTGRQKMLIVEEQYVYNYLSGNVTSVLKRVGIIDVRFITDNPGFIALCYIM
jgi:hypothetical protein